MITENDIECNRLFNKLYQLKKDGKESSEKDSEYMKTLYALREVTESRLVVLGLKQQSI